MELTKEIFKLVCTIMKLIGALALLFYMVRSVFI